MRLTQAGSLLGDIDGWIYVCACGDTRISTVPGTRGATGRAERTCGRMAWDGRASKGFEEGIERYLGLAERKVVSTNSCTEALHIAARLIGLGPGDEVICPAFTYVAGHQAMSRTGADIVFCDIEPKNLSIDPNKVVDLITNRTLGNPCGRLPRIPLSV